RRRALSSAAGGRACADGGARLLLGGDLRGVPQGGLLPDAAAAPGRRLRVRVPPFARLIVAVSRGCPSSGWCLCLGSAHALNVASLFSEQAQADAFGPDGDFCSGAPYAEHFLPVVLTEPGDPASIGLALVPSDRWTMLDDWATCSGYAAAAPTRCSATRG